jgi:alpha-tubulin suppressor-like RCC1 family protein
VTLAAAMTGFGGLGCLGPGDFHCDTHAQCGGAGAFCEVDGHCSLRDVSCPSSGRRYVREAGSESDRCVPDSCGTNTIAALVAGGEHACLVRKGDGAVWCWGRNDDGQLGDGTRTPRALAVRVPGVTAVAVAAGQRHTCVVRTGGAVACWGADDAGQLGDGSGAGALTPVAVALPMPAVAVAAGNDFSCALLADRSVRCWGNDDAGQLGDDGAAASTHLPSAVVGLEGVATLSAFWQHACAVRGDGTLACWGANSQGQLGDGTTTNRPHPVAVATLASAVAVGTGVAHTCAIAAPGELLCWGSNAYGQLGNGTSGPAPVTAPGLVSTVSAPRGLAVGAQHTCAAQSDGTMLCWGQNGSEQVGREAISILEAPVPVDPDLVVGTIIAAGGAFSCAVGRDGAVFCWGDDSYGQLGVGSGAVRATPALVPGITGAVSLSAGGAHTCVATAGSGGSGEPGTSFCWGADQAGQLGDGVTDDRSRPGPLTVDIGATVVGAGDAYTCAVGTPAGALWCWGRGSSGQLGLGPTKEFDWHQPVQVAVSGATAVAAGTAHTCVIVDGGVQCFGANDHGQLGDGTTTDRSTPPAAAVMGPVAPVTAVAVGGAHSCAIDAKGQLWCWGQGDEGEIGDGAGQDRPAPVPVELGTGAGVTAVAAGGAHTCAVDSGRDIWCWGRGAEGQIGGGTTNRMRPADLGLTGATDVAAGTAHTCVLTVAGSACFGANDQGQLGIGSTAPLTGGPGWVTTLPNIVALAAGGAHTCARLLGGTVACWGADTSGQLGDGVVLTDFTPALARISCD